MAEDLLLLLECHICSEIFNDDDRKPKVLPCQHTFCLSCLKKMAKTKFNPDSNGFFRMTLVSIKCPECSQEYNAPDGGVVNFINNLTMMELLRVLPQTSGESNDASDLKKCLSDRLARLQTKLSDVAEVRAKEVSTWEKEVNDAQDSIKKSFAELHQALDKKEAVLLAELKEFSHTRDNLVHRTMTRAFETQLQEIIEFCSVADDMINGKSCKVSERMISENLNKCLEIMEQLDGAHVNDEDDEKKWRVKFQAIQKGSVKASIENFGRLQLETPIAIAIASSVSQRAPINRWIYTREYLLAFQPKCLERPANLCHIPGVTLEQPEIQQLTEPPSSCTHRPLVASSAMSSGTAAAFENLPNAMDLPRLSGRRTAPPKKIKAKRQQHCRVHWLEGLESELNTLLAQREPDNEDVCNLVERCTTVEQRQTKEFIRILTTEFLENPGGPTGMQATLLGMSYSIPGYHVILRDRVAVLRKYIEASDDTDLELEVLYAAQAFNFDVGNPPALLMKVFGALADEDVVEEETFFDWLNCNDPAEQAGKEIAVMATDNFFKNLTEYQEQDDSNSPPASTHARNRSRFAYFGTRNVVLETESGLVTGLESIF